MKRSTPLERRTPLTRSKPLKRGKGFSASPEQQRKAREGYCVVTGRDRFEAVVDPTHLTDRSLGGCADPLCVIPLTRELHRLYDEHKLDLLAYLEPRYRAEIAHCVEHLGLIGALERITNMHWAPVEENR